MGEILSSSSAIEWFGEVWNANRAWIPSASRDKSINLINQLGLATEPVGQTNLHSFTRAHPGVFMDLCQNLEVPTEVKFLSSKLLWGHLPAHVIEREILPRPEVVTVCIVRDPIEGFISSTKAKAFGMWRDVDTTDFKPTLEVGEFEKWVNYRKNRISLVERNASNISATFSYEELLTGGSIDHRKLQNLLEGTK